MIRYKTLLYILICTLPFINFSLIPGSNLPLPYMALTVITLILIFSEKTIPAKVFGYEDLFFIVFLIIALVSILSNPLNSESFTQIINYILTYLFYKVSILLLIRSGADASIVLRDIYNYNTCLQIFALILFLIGFIYGRFLEETIALFNNSGNFSIGAISTTYPIARLFGFSPEPSFWSFLVAVNIAIALTIERPNKIFLAVNFISLIATFGRTGFLITGCIVLLKFLKGNVLQKLLGIVCIFIAFVLLGEYLDLNRLISVDVSFKQRIESLLVAIDLSKENLLNGIGLNNFKIYATEQKLDYLDIFNLFLNTLVSTGLFGLLSLILFLLLIFKRINSNYTLPFYAAMIGWMTVSSYNLPFLWFIFGVLVYGSYQANYSAKEIETHI
jgi:hypothetical protein